jgi:hypothetical protein
MKTMLTIQGFFYLITGIWPLLSVRTFEMVTGPKVDRWLLKTVGLLVASSGMVFLYTALINPLIPVETLLLAVLNGLSLAAIDIHFVRKKRISRVYLADAGVEIFIAGFYLINFPW